jgi:ABC-type sugar transport system substrate-binding protein
MWLKDMSKRGLTVLALALSLSACVSSGVDDYEGFRSALEKDAPCSELIDMRDGLAGTDRDKATADLEEIGCVE